MSTIPCRICSAKIVQKKNSRAEGKEVLAYLVLASWQSSAPPASARVESRAEGLLVLLG